MEEQKDKPQSAPAGGGSPWLLVVAALIALAAGGTYLWKWQLGVRGADLLGFTSLWVALPLALSLILMFSHFNKQRKH